MAGTCPRLSVCLWAGGRGLEEGWAALGRDPSDPFFLGSRFLLPRVLGCWGLRGNSRKEFERSGGPSVSLHKGGLSPHSSRTPPWGPTLFTYPRALLVPPMAVLRVWG